MANNGIFYTSGNTLDFTTTGTTWARLSSGGTFSSLGLSATTYYNLPFSGTVTGSGTSGYVPKWTGGSSLGNSLITDDGSRVTIPDVIVNSSFEFIPAEYEGRVAPIYNLAFFESSSLVKPWSNDGYAGAEDESSGAAFLTLSNDSDSRAIEVLYTLRSTDDGNFRSGKIIANWDRTYTNFYQTEYGPSYDLTTMTFIDPPRVIYGGSGTVIRITINYDNTTDPANLLTARFKYTLI
jgi:hypothetical protein